MDRIMVICGILIAMFIGGLIGYMMREGSYYTHSMAWGYEEKSNVWNRIRVDEVGFVMCHKE